MKPYGLKINLLEAPFGLREGLAFGWKCDFCGRGHAQRSYRIVISESIADMERRRYIFDSGNVVTDESAAAEPDIPRGTLACNRLYFWAVTVTDDTGSESDLSEPQAFSTGVGSEWISKNGIWDAADSDFLFMRREIELGLATVSKVIVSVTARSPEPARQYVYSLSVNGKSVGVGPTRIGRAPDGQKLLYYNTYDITGFLTDGRNALGVVCYTEVDKQFLCQTTAFYTDGSRRILNSGADVSEWRCLGGDGIFGNGKNSIGTHYYYASANNIDAELYPFGFDQPGFDCTGWEIPAVRGEIDADMRLCPSQIMPVRRFESPKDGYMVLRVDGNAAVIDLGREIVGGVRFTALTDGACDLTVTYGEMLTEDGGVKFEMNTSNRYIESWRLKPGRQSFETVDMLTFRYVGIAGDISKIKEYELTGLELRADLPEAGELVSNDRLLSDMYALAKHTVRVTTQDIYVDSQSRERGAYEGDLLVNMLASYAVSDSYSPARLTAEYLLTHRTWPAEYILYAVCAAREDYTATGNRALIREYYDILKSNNFAAYTDGSAGLLASGNPGQSGNDAILTDWPPSERDGYDTAVSFNTVLNAVAVRAYRDMAFISGELGYAEDKSRFETAAEKLREAMIARLYDPGTGAFCDGAYADGRRSEHFSQHATAYALACGVYPDSETADRLAAFLGRIGKIRMSVFGAFFLLEGLYKSGHAEIANKLLLDGDVSEGARTWAYMMYKLGATVTTEAWNPANKPNMTMSHPWGAANAHAIARGIFGVNPTRPGYAEFEIRPGFDGVTSAEISIPTVKGIIRVAFDDGLLNIDVPFNSTAKLIRDGAETALLSGRYTIINMEAL